MDNISIYFQLDDTKSRWDFRLFGDKTITGTLLNYCRNTSGELLSVVIQSYRGPVIEIPWHNVQYVVHSKER